MNRFHISRPTAYQTARGVAFAAAIFSAVLCILLLATFVQLTRVDPLNSEALASLEQRLRDNPSDEALRQEIRSLNLLARKAYFASRWQLKTGGWLLLGGLLVTAAALTVMDRSRREIPIPEGSRDTEQTWLEVARSRKWLAAGGGVLVLAAVILAITARDPGDLESAAEPAPEQQAAAAQEAQQGEPPSQHVPAEPPAADTAEPQPVPTAAVPTPQPTEVAVAAAEPTTTPAPQPPAAAAAKPFDPATSWPAFRGPGGNGVATTSTAPLEWDGEKGTGITWKVEVPREGYSSPVVANERVFVTGGDDKVREVFCFDAKNGKLLWRHEASGIAGSPDKPPRVHNDTGYAPNTMATDGNAVFAIYPTGDLVALNMEGTRLWALNLGVPDNHYGHSSSLIIADGKLIVQYDQRKDSKLLALDTASGKTVWQTPRTAISWSSPIVVNTGARTEVILTNSKGIDSYDPKTGKLLWGEECLGGEMGPSAAYANGMVFGANDYAVVAGVKLGGGGAKLAWEWDEDLPDTASPVARGSFLFIACSYGYIVCLDAASGESHWGEEFDDGFYASPIIVGDRVYALDLQGVMHVFKVADTYQALATSPLGESSACTPAFVGERIFMRGDTHLFCITGA